MENPSIGKKFKVLTSKQNAPKVSCQALDQQGSNEHTETHLHVICSHCQLQEPGRAPVDG